MEIGHDFNANPLWGLLTLFVACLGEGKPLALLSMSVRLLRRLTDTALRAAFRSLPSPQAPPLPQRAFTGEKSKTRGTLVPKANGAYTACLVYLLKLFVKFILTGPPSPSGCTRMQGETP